MRKIIVRFDSEKDLTTFSKKISLDLNSNVKELFIPSKEITYRKIVPKRGANHDYAYKEWFDMPEYISNKQEPFAKIDVFIDDSITLDYLNDLFEQKITDKIQSIWFPKLISGKHSKLRVVGGTRETKYPIYVVSKGRSKRCLTSQFLSRMEVKHYVAVEPSEVELYKNSLDKKYATVLRLDMSFKDNYDTFDELGNTKSKGPGGARNFCWEHSIKNGHKWHWVMDDNAKEGFHYMNNNNKQKCRTSAMFRACEHFVDRYKNIAIAGLNYSGFCKMSDKTPPFVLNTRIYSFLLIRNDIKYRWRGRYNEDTDLSLRVLKDGWCTVQFNAFLAGKATTQTIKGGNTDEFYSKEGTYPKSKMLEDMHPDIAKVVWKFNRWHHQVDYSGFKQKLKLKDGESKDNKVNNFEMIVINTDEEDSKDSRSYLEEKYKDAIERALTNT